jgi:hypothetical protein
MERFIFRSVKRNKLFKLFLIVAAVVITSVCILKASQEPDYFVDYLRGTSGSQGHSQEIFDFEGFDNENGSDTQIVPNIIHLIYLETTEIQFYQAMNIYSIYLNHAPELIFIHCDNCSFHGHYWNEIKSIRSLFNRIKLKPLKFHYTIFGVNYGWPHYHQSDVLRILVLMNWGGIFLDNDVYVVNSLNKYRKYEMTVSWDDPNQSVGVQVLIAHRNARLLKAHFDQYR